MIRKIRNKFKLLYYKYILSPEKYAIKIGVIVGKNCNISTKNFSSEPYLISIGDNVRLAKNVQLFTHGGLWSIRKTKKEYNKLDYYGKIVISNNVYIGQGAFIMPGVIIGENCIIGAASVVTKSVPPNSVIAGNPARIISNIDSFVTRILAIDTQLHGLEADVKIEKIKNLPEDKFVVKPFLKRL